jgi:hypothetical protein
MRHLLEIRFEGARMIIKPGLYPQSLPSPPTCDSGRAACGLKSKAAEQPSMLISIGKNERADRMGPFFWRMISLLGR